MHKHSYLQGHKLPYRLACMTTLASRLKQARKEAGLTQRELAEAAGIQQPVISQIEKGQNQQSAHIAKLAHACRVRALWLSDGVGPKHIDEDDVPEQSNIAPGPDTKGLLPLISWVQAGSWSEVIDLYAVGDAEDWLPCPANHGPRSFALRVRGESMYDPHGRRSFREGDIVYVDPDRQSENGSLVIAKLTDSQEATFKQLVIEDEKRYLKALNPSWPERMMPINGNCIIVGVVFSKVELF